MENFFKVKRANNFDYTIFSSIRWILITLVSRSKFFLLLLPISIIIAGHLTLPRYIPIRLILCKSAKLHTLHIDNISRPDIQNTSHTEYILIFLNTLCYFLVFIFLKETLITLKHFHIGSSRMLTPAQIYPGRVLKGAHFIYFCSFQHLRFSFLFSKQPCIPF